MPKPFQSYQSETDYSFKLSKNRKFLNAFGSQNSKKTYEALVEIANYKDFSIEVYNSRLEIFLFSGRQLYPDILSCSVQIRVKDSL